MRTINFRDGVLWAVWRKMGNDPLKSLFRDYAPALVTHINSWVRKLWDATDWPEWTTIIEATPDSEHYVPYDIPVSSDEMTPVGRVLKVYLADPDVTPRPLDTPFRLRDRGIHVGFEHGTNVWIKYLPPAPEFTAREWSAAQNYAKGALVYAARTGECYKSKTSGNLGHDPAQDVIGGTFNTEIIQERIVGIPAGGPQPEVLVIGFTDVTPPIVIPPIPVLNAYFFIEIIDAETNVQIAFVTHFANGAETLSTILTNLAADLETALGGTWTATADTTAKTITVTHESNFTAGLSYYARPADYLPRHYFGIVQAQIYLVVTPAIPGQPQITKVSLASAQVVPGSIYTMLIRTGSTAVVYTAEYQSIFSDSGSEIIQGLAAAVITLPIDVLIVNLDTELFSMNLSTNSPISVDAFYTPQGSPWWEANLFPLTLAVPVVRGAYADALREEGQTDKAGVEEQAMTADTAVATGKFMGQTFDVLTDQQKPRSRYRQ
jgi:hypothetical protein